MQTRSQLRIKNSLIQQAKITQTNIESQNQKYIFIPYGSLLNDGTFTQKMGQGSGSHHGGVKTILYKKQQNSQIQKTTNKKDLIASSPKQNKKVSQRQEQKLRQPKNEVQQKRSKKIFLKDTIKTKSKKQSIYNKLQQIFKTFFKDQIQIIPEQINQEMWIIISSVCSMYDKVYQMDETIRALEDQIYNKKLKKTNEKLNNQTLNNYNQVASNSAQEVILLKYENQQLIKTIQKIQKKNSRLEQKIKQLKLRGKTVQKMLKSIQLNSIKNMEFNSIKTEIQQKKLKTKKTSKVESKISMQTKFQEFNQRNMSFFSDSSSQFIDEDFTIRDFVRNIK